MQQLGRAAGLPAPGPLALQVHPRFGPWWAYRAFAVVGLALPPEAPLTETCPTCPAPCVTACPGEAVRVAGFSLDRCADRRRLDEKCGYSCAARLACPVGATACYPAAQLRFHMAASLVQIRRSSGPARA
jgi:epoxyqueuosine reductase QueG